MAVTVLVDITCPNCGAVNQRREIVADVVPGCTISPREIVWCRQCRTELSGDGGVPSDGAHGPCEDCTEYFDKHGKFPRRKRKRAGER